jgi:DNA (cytosine-5)-methyltransferase 1
VASRSIAGLALCAGAGGLELGLKLALGERYRTVGYVERDAYAAAVLVARMDETALDRAPVWDDLSTFRGGAWRRRVDIISAGFPCQPASHAGRRQGRHDKRWLWPDIARTVADVEPRYVFIENVIGLLTVNGGGAFRQVVGTLASLGFDAEWDVFSAANVGAPHLRKRLFLLAHRHGRGLRINGASAFREFVRGYDTDGGQPGMGHPESERLEGRLDGLGARERFPFPPGPGATGDAWAAILAERPDLAPAIEPGLRGVVDGPAGGVGRRWPIARADQLRVLGNGVIPLVAAVAFMTLVNRAEPV